MTDLGDIKFVLLDIEGTTTPISFVHDHLFPYAYDKLDSFLADNFDLPQVKQALALVDSTVREESPAEAINAVLSSPADYAAVLKQMIQQDRKHTGLKDIQGMIWKQGYESGDVLSEIYDDVVPALERWKSRGLRIGIYSSGSIQAQKLLFKHTKYGDLTVYFENYFDTTSGPKREPDSYLNIIRQLEVDGSSVLFLSDHPAEIEAASRSGLATIHITRPGTPVDTHHSHADDFSKIL